MASYNYNYGAPAANVGGYAHPQQTQQQQQQQQQSSSALTPFYAPRNGNGNGHSNGYANNYANGQQNHAAQPTNFNSAAAGANAVPIGYYQQPGHVASNDPYAPQPYAPQPYAQAPPAQQYQQNHAAPFANPITAGPKPAPYSAPSFHSNGQNTLYTGANMNAHAQMPANFNSNGNIGGFPTAAPAPAAVAPVSAPVPPNVVETEAVAVPFDPWGDNIAPVPAAAAVAAPASAPPSFPPSVITTKTDMAPPEPSNAHGDYMTNGGRLAPTENPNQPAVVTASHNQHGYGDNFNNGHANHHAYDGANPYQQGHPAGYAANGDGNMQYREDWKKYERSGDKKQRRKHRRRGRMAVGAASGVIVGTLALGPVGFVLGGPVGAAVARHASKKGEKRKDKKAQRDLTNERGLY